MIDLSHIPDAELFAETSKRLGAKGRKPPTPCQYCGRIVGKTPERRKHETQCKRSLAIPPAPKTGPKKKEL
jgi:hypothetical protein